MEGVQRARARRLRSGLWKNPEVISFVEHCHATSEPLSSIDRLRFGVYLNQWIWAYVQLFENSPEEEWVRLRPGVSGDARTRCWGILERDARLRPSRVPARTRAILATQSEEPAGEATSD